MGSIRARANTGKLFIDFRFQGIRCREQTLLTDTPFNRQKLQALLDRIELNIADGTFVYEEVFPNSAKAKSFKQGDVIYPEFGDFAQEWWLENAFRWKKSGKVNMRSILDKHILPRFSDMPISDITKGEVLKFRSALSKLPGRGNQSISNKRINNILQPLKSIMDEASDRYKLESPFKNFKRLPLKKHHIEPFTMPEVIDIIQTADPNYRNYLVVRFFSGMRTGELHGLRWKNVSFQDNYIHVCEAFTYGEMTTPKTNEIRDIQMNSAVAQAMREQEKYSRPYSEYVFCNRKGEPLDNSNFTKRIWYPLLKELGLTRRRPYQTRHTAATLWLAAGENPEWVARQLGHSNTQMLFQTYSRFIPNATRNDGSAFEKLLSNSNQSKLTYGDNNE
ncbi:MAG: hypothetical protein COB79_02885 [Zetaproteobacteria bacterium]|nr:MAG: hypothetical protein COB79_02885 [Zetaproteobacteria bacterium]